MLSAVLAEEYKLIVPVRYSAVVRDERQISTV